jgi:hypothetical protein
MAKPIAAAFAALVAFAPMTAGFARTSASSASGASRDSAAQVPHPQQPSPVSRNRDDCNKVNCVDNGGG